MDLPESREAEKGNDPSSAVNDQMAWLTRLWNRKYLGLPLIVWASAVLIAVLLGLAFTIPNPTESQGAIIRLLIALCAAVASTLLFGGLTAKGPLKGISISATGPMAVFVLLQFVTNPIRLVTPSAPAGDIVTSMTPRPCHEEGQLRSIQAETQSAVFFKNESKFIVKVYWLDYGGKRQFFADLAPGRDITLSTFVTHPWLVANGAEGCRAIYLPEVETPAVVIR